MDETGQPGADATAAANGAAEHDGRHERTPARESAPWPANGSSGEALPGWRQYGSGTGWPPVGTARVRGDDTPFGANTDRQGPYGDFGASAGGGMNGVGPDERRDAPPGRPLAGSGPGGRVDSLRYAERPSASDQRYGDSSAGTGTQSSPAGPSALAAPTAGRPGSSARPPLSLVPPLAEAPSRAGPGSGIDPGSGPETPSRGEPPPHGGPSSYAVPVERPVGDTTVDGPTGQTPAVGPRPGTGPASRPSPFSPLEPAGSAGSDTGSSPFGPLEEVRPVRPVSTPSTLPGSHPAPPARPAPPLSTGGRTVLDGPPADGTGRPGPALFQPPLPEPAPPLPEPAPPLPAALPVPTEPDPPTDPVSRAPAPEVARADAGRHAEPSEGSYSAQPADLGEERGPAAAGRRHGERSPWAPASLPPGYERIPTARVAPPPEYEEVSAYRESGGGYGPPGEYGVPGGYGAAAEPAEQSAHVDPPWRADPPWPEPHWSEPSWSDSSTPDPSTPTGEAPGWGERAAHGPPHRALLPQRVPAEPDVPRVPGAPGVDPEPGGLPAAAPELARIASYLRDEDDDCQVAQPDGFDIPAVLAAVRVVPGVRDAHVRTNASGAQTLRLELADDADPAEVSRAVTRLLNERMGLAAEPNAEVSDPASAPTVPGRRRAVEDDDPVARTGHRSAWQEDADGGDRALGRCTTDRPASGEERSDADPLRVNPSEPSAPESTEQRTHRRARAAETPGTEQRVTEARALGSRGTRGRVPGVPDGPAYRPGAEAARTDTARTEAARTDTARTDTARVDVARTDTARVDVARTDTGRAEPGRDAARAHRPLRGASGVARVVLDRVEVSTQGSDAVVEVRLSADAAAAVGVAQGPAFDGYVLRVAALAAANAIDDLLSGADGTPVARCLIENATVVPMGGCEVAVVVLLLAHDGWAEQLSGAAVVDGDQRHAVVRATLAAVNRRLEALLP